jgi:hypothetical protein
MDLYLQCIQRLLSVQRVQIHPFVPLGLRRPSIQWDPMDRLDLSDL